MSEPTDDMVDAYQDSAWEHPTEYGGQDFPNVRAGLTAVLAIVERDQASTQDAYDAAVRALEKHRARAAIHADTLLQIHKLLDEYRGPKALREGVRVAIEQGARQCDELVARTTGSKPGGAA